MILTIPPDGCEPIRPPGKRVTQRADGVELVESAYDVAPALTEEEKEIISSPAGRAFIRRLALDYVEAECKRQERR